MIVAIHQPNYLPWLGYFHKMKTVDLFIFLDDCRHSKSAITNKNRILLGGREALLSIPLKNKEQNFVKNRIGNHIVCRGVHVPFELIDNFIKTLDKVKESKKAVRVTAEELLEEGLIKKPEEIKPVTAEELLKEEIIKKEQN